jgi:hypothetical protein
MEQAGMWEEDKDEGRMKVKDRNEIKIKDRWTYKKSRENYIARQ